MILQTFKKIFFMIPRMKEVRDNLIEQKNLVEEKIRDLDKTQVKEKIMEALKKIDNVNESLSALQDSLNVVWKKTQQIEEELKSAYSI